MPDLSLLSLLSQCKDRLDALESGELDEAERKQLDQLQRRSEQLLLSPEKRRRERAVQIHFEYALHGIIEADADGRIIEANPAAASILQRHRKQLPGTRLPALFAEASRDKTAQHFALLAEQGINHAELLMAAADGTRELSLSSIQVDENLYLHVLDDVTDDRRLSRELLQAQQAAEAANAAKGQFLANISHEIRNPMNGIIGLTQLALMTPLSPEQRDYLEKISQSGRTMLALLNDLLDFSKIESGKLEFEHHRFDLYAVLDELSVLCAHSLTGRPIDVIFDLGSEVPRHLVGDQLRITQILINLLGNALKFTQQGGISLKIEATAAVDGKKIVFSVADTGCGIAPKTLERLFQPFSQADAGTTRRFGGTGLGLVISRQLAEGMGGTLTVTSTPGQGSVFTLGLPLQTADSPALSPAIADDVPQFAVASANQRHREAMTDLVRHLGWHSAASDEAAIRLLDCPPGEGLRQIQESAGLPPSILLVSPDELGPLNQQAAKQPGIAVVSRPLTPLALIKAYQALQRPVSSPPPDPAMEVPTEFQGACIAVAEDVAVNQQVIRGLLERAGIRVLVADNGRHLLDELDSGQFVPEMILMDVHMPELDGLDTTRALRARGFRPPIIALSAAANPEERARCLAAGMNDFLAKPIDVDDLWGVLTCWLPPRESAAPLPAPATDRPGTAIPDWLLDAGIDVDAALERFLGDVAALENGVGIFNRQHATAAEWLATALAEADHARFVQIAHAVLGGAAVIGANELAALCRQAEKLTTAEWQSAAPALIADIAAQLARIAPERADDSPALHG